MSHDVFFFSNFGFLLEDLKLAGFLGYFDLVQSEEGGRQRKRIISFISCLSRSLEYLLFYLSPSNFAKVVFLCSFTLFLLSLFYNVLQRYFLVLFININEILIL